MRAGFIRPRSTSASVVFRQRVERDGVLLVEAEIILAIVDRARMKPARMPQELEQALT